MTKLKMTIINMLILGTLLIKGPCFEEHNHYYPNSDGTVTHYEIVNDKENHKVNVYEDDNLILSKNYWK